MISRADFRVRKLPDGRWRVEQLEAGRWVPLWAEVYSSREEALAAVDKWCGGAS